MLTPEQRAIAAVKAAVQVGLRNTFGFSQTTLDQLIKDGKIVIEVDLENLTTTVTIDPSVTLPVGAVNLTDPLGENKLPAEIHYQLRNKAPGYYNLDSMNFGWIECSEHLWRHGIAKNSN